MKHSLTHKITFGFWLYLMSDCVLFAGLFATYAVLRGATFGGASIAGIVDLPFVLVETLILLASSFFMGVALVLSAKSDSSAEKLRTQRGYIFGALLITLLLGLAFLGLELSEFRTLILEGNGPSTSAFLSAFFALVGTHGLHVAAGSLWMIVLMAHLWMRGITDSTLTKLACLGLFWHFLDIIWIFIFTVVYLFGAL